MTKLRIKAMRDEHHGIRYVIQKRCYLIWLDITGSYLRFEKITEVMEHIKEQIENGMKV